MRTSSEGHYSVYLSRCKEHISPKYCSRRKAAPARETEREGDGGGERRADTHSHPASSGGGSFLAGWLVYITLEKLVMFLH